jgi:hypothetical protein
MKTTIQLTSEDLKAGLIPWMAASASDTLKSVLVGWLTSRGIYVDAAATFEIDSSDNVTVTITNAPVAPAVSGHGPIIGTTPPPVTSPPATLAPVVSPIPPISTTTPGHLVQVDPPFSITGQATEFGYKDTTDNGLGFFYDPATGKPYQTNNDVIRGVSLPREVLLSTFLKIDSWKTEGIISVWSRNEDLLRQWVDGNKPLVTIDSGGKSAADLPIVDAGPSAGTDNAIDCTGKIAMELRPTGADPTQFKQLATYMIVVAGAPIPIRGWDFSHGKVG